jgi:hypothetical protein
MTDEEMVKTFERIIYSQLRTLGTELYDDAGNRMKPGSGEENRIVSNIARNIAQLVVLDRESHKLVAEALIHAVKFAGGAYDSLGIVLETDLKEPLIAARKLCQTGVRDFAL